MIPTLEITNMNKLNHWARVCKTCGKNPINLKSNAAKYDECETCFWAEGFTSPATIINKKFGFRKI